MSANKKTYKLFFKSLSITLVAVLLVAGGTFALLRALVRPPTVPTYSAMPFFNPYFDEDSAFDFAEHHPDDKLLNLESPLNLVSMEGWTRKPDFVTVLVFGYDEGLNTDTIMVTAFDAETRGAYIVSVPRDTIVDVSRNMPRLNSAYPVGLRFGGDGHASGVDQLKREIQTVIGFRPDFYVSVDEDAFARLIDAIGGVMINVPFHMRYFDPCQNLRINIPPGFQRLDGENALNFARFRNASYGGRAITDHQRMVHNQQLMSAIKDEMMTPRLIARIPELIGIYRDNVRTDLSLTDLLWLAEQFVLGDISLNSYNYPTISQRRLPNANATNTVYFEIPQATEALELINRTINPFTRELTMANLQLVE